MPNISTGSINIPAPEAAIMKAESLAILEERQPLDTSLESVPNADPTTWTNKQLIQYHMVNGPNLTEVLRDGLVATNAGLIAALADSATKQAAFDAARAEHNAATVALAAARQAARDAADATVTGFALT